MRTMTSLLAIGLGAAAFSMTNSKRRKRMARMIQPMFNVEMAEMMPTKKTVRRIRKRVMKAMS